VERCIRSFVEDGALPDLALHKMEVSGSLQFLIMVNAHLRFAVRMVSSSPLCKAFKQGVSQFFRYLRTHWGILNLSPIITYDEERKENRPLYFTVSDASYGTLKSHEAADTYLRGALVEDSSATISAATSSCPEAETFSIANNMRRHDSNYCTAESMGSIQLGEGRKMIGIGSHNIPGGAEMWGGDNAPVLRIMSSGGLSKKGRALTQSATSIRVRVRKKQQRNRRFLCKVPTDENTSDMGTKLLDEKKFNELMEHRGIYMAKDEDYSSIETMADVSKFLMATWDDFMDNSFEKRCPLPPLWKGMRYPTPCSAFDH